MNDTPERQIADFVRVLAEAIKTSGLSHAEIARRVGRSGAAITQWFSKGDLPDLAVVFKLEPALGISFGTLVQLHSPEVWEIIRRQFDGSERDT